MVFGRDTRSDAAVRWTHALAVATPGCLGASTGEVRAEERAFLETETTRDTYFVHEPIRLRLRVGDPLSVLTGSADAA